MTVQLQEDVWKHPDDGGASQLAAKGEAHLVLSGADGDRLARKMAADSFLVDAKAEFHGSIVIHHLSIVIFHLPIVIFHLSIVIFH